MMLGLGAVVCAMPPCSGPFPSTSGLTVAQWALPCDAVSTGQNPSGCVAVPVPDGTGPLGTPSAYITDYDDNAPVVWTSASTGQKYCGPGASVSPPLPCPSSSSTSASTATSWLTSPAREVIPNVPNWALVAAAGVAAFILMEGF